MNKQCVLYDRLCIGCGECDKCDLDPNKICDNCMKCVKQNKDYASVIVDGIILQDQQAQKGSQKPQ